MWWFDENGPYGLIGVTLFERISTRGLVGVGVALWEEVCYGGGL